MTCPSNPPAPAGYRVWRGSVPKELTDWAISIRDRINTFPYGMTWNRDYNGQSVVARKDYHTWTHRGGELVTGICIPGVTLYSPLPGALGLSPIANTGDPLATPDDTMAIFDAANASSGPDWTVVAFTGAALALVVGGFLFVIRK